MTDKIKNAEVEKIKTENLEESPEELLRAKKRDWYVELALVLILGILIGVALKTEASKKITIGFEDYKNKATAQYYNINQMRIDLGEKMREEARKAGETDVEKNEAEQNQEQPGNQ